MKFDPHFFRDRLRKPTSKPMKRIGGRHDGGYVLADDLDGVDRCLTFGVGSDVSFELDLASRDIDSILFDHTVPGLPQSHPRMCLIRSPWREPASGIDTVIPIDGGEILKFDVEGDEWRNLSIVMPDMLYRFRQIVGEFHDIGNQWNPAVFEMLSTHHELIHVHPNNFGGTFDHNGQLWPNVIEMTWIRRDRSNFKPHDGIFPIAQDSPNCPTWPDVRLPSFL